MRAAVLDQAVVERPSRRVGCRERCRLFVDHTIAALATLFALAALALVLALATLAEELAELERPRVVDERAKQLDGGDAWVGADRRDQRVRTARADVLVRKVHRVHPARGHRQHAHEDLHARVPQGAARKVGDGPVLEGGRWLTIPQQKVAEGVHVRVAKANLVRVPLQVVRLGCELMQVEAEKDKHSRMWHDGE